jgi:hypothetical protein
MLLYYKGTPYEGLVSNPIRKPKIPAKFVSKIAKEPLFENMIKGNEDIMSKIASYLSLQEIDLLGSIGVEES